MAAAAVLLFFLFNPFAAPDLYREYANPAPLALADKSTAATAAVRAEMTFNQGDYAAAYSALKIYLSENEEDTQAKLALGIAALETDNYDEAADIFRQISNGQSMLRSEGTWYLALLYLKEEDFARAAEVLKTLDNDPVRGEQSRELQRKLR